MGLRVTEFPLRPIEFSKMPFYIYMYIYIYSLQLYIYIYIHLYLGVLLILGILKNSMGLKGNSVTLRPIFLYWGVRGVFIL